MNDDQPLGGKITGTDHVTADDFNKDGKLDQWIMTPNPGTGDQADIYIKHSETGNENINCPSGTFPMPFKLVLDRL